MSTVTETAIDAIDALRDVGGRLANEFPSNVTPPRLPTNLEWPANIEWSDDVVDRVVGGSRSLVRRPLLVGGIVVGVIVAVVWFARRRRSSTDVEHRIRQEAETSSAA